MQYTLQTGGDGIEKLLFFPLIQPRFPSYEVFWQKFVVPLTNRPTNVQFKTDPDLVAIGKGDHDLCLAQLHYSVLRHLGRAFQLRQDPDFGLDHLVFSLSAIVGAQDVAFELLERFRDPTSYGAWFGKKTEGIEGAREAQLKWKKSNKFPLQAIRDYRNHLVHGRTPPGFDNQYPKIGNESAYFDWRKVTAVTAFPVADFSSAMDIHDSAFDQTMNYFESMWASELLPNI